MEFNGVERSRAAVIGGVLSSLYASSVNASLLDVGCGEGAISDFITMNQKAKYVGVDISKEAIHLAKSKRGPPLRFVHSAAHTFQPKNNFDVVVFSEVLYYVEHEKVISQYLEYLNPKGIMIISNYHLTEQLLPEHQKIFDYARSHLTFLDEVDISGYINKMKGEKKIKTGLHLEVYRKK